MTCGNCKYWKPPNPPPSWEVASGFGCCVRIQGPQDKNDDDVLEGYSLAKVEDASDYLAQLFTKPAFECIAFEAITERPEE